jgi:hypothetical protein
MNITLVDAVRFHRILTFWYEDLLRTVEPHLYGVHAETGSEILSGFQIGGSSHSSNRPGWRYFLVSEIRGLSVSEGAFAGPRPGYNPNDPRLRIVYARV